MALVIGLGTSFWFWRPWPRRHGNKRRMETVNALRNMEIVPPAGWEL
jgi:hypothetical protein